jgi:hypothetical protein
MQGCEKLVLRFSFGYAVLSFYACSGAGYAACIFCLAAALDSRETI